jgi:hypothetical protein
MICDVTVESNLMPIMPSATPLSGAVEDHHHPQAL